MIFSGDNSPPREEAPPAKEGQEPLVWANGQFVTCDQGTCAIVKLTSVLNHLAIDRTNSHSWIDPELWSSSRYKSLRLGGPASVRECH